MENLHFSCIRENVREGVEHMRQLLPWKILWIEVSSVDGPFIACQKELCPETRGSAIPIDKICGCAIGAVAAYAISVTQHLIMPQRHRVASGQIDQRQERDKRYKQHRECKLKG